jgi:hypothetical protein
VNDWKSRRRVLLAAVCSAVLWAIVLQAVKLDRFFAGANDFAQLYAGATLIGTPELYVPEANQKVHRETVGYVIPSVYYSRLPFYAWMLRSLAGLPYRAAYWTFQAVSVACLGWFLWVFVKDRLDVALFAFLYPPLVFTPLNGQDVSIVLALASAGYLLMERDRPFTAGLLWSLCAIKPHLVLLLPLVLVTHRKWRALAGGVAGGAALAALSFVAQGPGWITEYLGLLARDELHPSPELMPNLTAIGAAFPALATKPLAVAASLAAAALAGLAFARSARWSTAFALCIPASLLLSVHAYAQDALLLLLPLALTQMHPSKPAMVRFAALMAAPLTPFVILAGSPWSAIYPALLAAWLSAAALMGPDPPALAPARTQDL